MKKILISLVFLAAIKAPGQLIQGTIKPGMKTSQADIYLKPDFSNSTAYLIQLQFPVAFPASTSPVPEMTVDLDPEFINEFGNYSTSIYPLAHNKAGDVNYYVVSLIRNNSSSAQIWTAGKEFRVMTVNFKYASGLKQVKLADFQDGGSDSQGNFYTVDGTGHYYIPGGSNDDNSIGNYYSDPGKSTIGGDAKEGYAQTTPITIQPVTINSSIQKENVDEQEKVLPTTLAVDGLFPNPATNLVKLKISSPGHNRISLFITDISGKMVDMKSFNSEPGINIIPVEVSKLSGGSYNIKLISSYNEAAVLVRFIKQ